jgi:hypothetical protein
MLLEWKRVGATVFAGYIVGFPTDTPESVLRDIKIIQRELPIDLLEPHCLTPLPGSEDHQKLHKAGVYLDPDLNNYNLEHVTTPHATMSAKTGVPPCRLRVRSFSILLIFSTWFISKSSWPSWSGATVASASSWRDPNARRYTDLALTPASEQELDSPEMFTLSAAAKSPHQGAPTGGRAGGNHIRQFVILSSIVGEAETLAEKQSQKSAIPSNRFSQDGSTCELSARHAQSVRAAHPPRGT